MTYFKWRLWTHNQIACSRRSDSNARCSDGGEPVACRCFLTQAQRSGARGTLIAAAILNSFQLSGSINVQDGGITLFRKKKNTNMDHAAKDVCFGGLGESEKGGNSSYYLNNAWNKLQVRSRVLLWLSLHPRTLPHFGVRQFFIFTGSKCTRMFVL